MGHETQILIVMVIYLSLLIAWGIFKGRKVKSNKDFSIAGRNLKGWTAALSERATGESSWALLGLPGAAYATGLLEIWTAIGCVLGIITAWALLAFRLSRESHKYDATTFTDFIAKKFGKNTKTIRMVSSFTIVFFFFFYVGAQFLGGGKTLHTMFEIKPEIGMLITAAIIVPYTIYGGFQSVVHTDVIQAVVMIITLIAAPIVGVFHIANNPDVYANTIGTALNNAGTDYDTFIDFAGGFSTGIVILGGFSWFFGYLGGQPQLSTRFMAIKDEKQAKFARNVGIAWTVVAYIGALTIGWLGIAIFGPQGLDDPEYVMPSVLLEIFPVIPAAILITGAIAAMISTADSLLILSSTELSENIIKPLSKKKITGKKSLFFSRFITSVLAVIALVVAYFSPADLIYTLVSYVWAGIGGTFSVVIILLLFWKKFHSKAAVITIITGMTFTIVWISTGMEKIISSRILTFFVAAIVAVLSSLFIKKN